MTEASIDINMVKKIIRVSSSPYCVNMHIGIFCSPCPTAYMIGDPYVMRIIKFVFQDNDFGIDVQ